MRLALDASQTSGSIALEDAGRVVYSACFDIDITHSEALMPQVDHALKFCGFRPADISTLLLTLGPGSFTGLRIGLATAKGIAYGLKIPLLTFDTLRLCSLARYHCRRRILAVLDAKMKEIYAALYDENLCEIEAPRVCSPEEVADWDLENCYVLGSGAPIIAPVFQNRKLETISVPSQPLNAAGLFTLAELFPQNESYDFDRLARLDPLYLRESTAQIRRRQQPR